VGRLGSSVLQGVGHAEWIARTEDEYIDKAVALARDLPTLARLRAGLRAQMEASALMDEAGFARKVEAAYREMFGSGRSRSWRKAGSAACRGKPWRRWPHGWMARRRMKSTR